MTWQDRFDSLLKAMVGGEPHKAERRAEKAVKANEEKAPTPPRN